LPTCDVKIFLEELKNAVAGGLLGSRLAPRLQPSELFVGVTDLQGSRAQAGFSNLAVLLARHGRTHHPVETVLFLPKE